MPRPFLSPRNDLVFKLLFGDARNTGPLTDFLKAALDLPPEDLLDIVLVDPHLNGEGIDDKQGVLDVKAKTGTGKMIDIEIQVAEQPQMRERIIFYLSRMITEQVSRGESYQKIERSICILITDYVQIPENDCYHNRYRLHDPRTGSEFSDIMEVNTLELTKLPHNTDGSALWDWLKFLDARQEEELKMLAEKNPQIGKAVARLQELSEDERTRLLAESREKMEWDNAARMQAAREKGLKEGLEKGREEGLEKGREEGRGEGREEGLLSVAHAALKRNLPIEEIMALTGLSREAILSLTH
ncbi:MAG: Rpn family recombination-promoting nuclease/putative transposase [Betaproteobacteria bacterium]|nr:Rpn family recombination-promoting nuclease/putative transposase [Betaproteobacteria bacterium]